LQAEKAGLASITVESGQIALRFPDGEIPADLPDLGSAVRLGKIALWMPYNGAPEWIDRLLEVLAVLASRPRESSANSISAPRSFVPDH
jgi:transcription-repair coupling factor (superfamily II helicase)